MNPEDQLVLFVAVVWVIVLAGFALPSVIAFRRRDPNRWLILAINASVVGWAISLIMALSPMFKSGLAGGHEGARTPDDLPLESAHAALAGPSASFLVGTGAEQLSSAAAVAEIERLGRLHAGGHLNEAEFSALKKRVLERL